MVNNNKLHAIFFILLIFICCRVFGNEPQNEVGLWPGVELSYKINKKITIGVDEQIRYDVNSHKIKWFVTNFDVSTKLNKRARLSTKYRFKKRANASHHSIYLDVNYRTKKRLFRPIYRLRYNKKIRFEKDGSDETFRKRDEDHIRNRLLIEHTGIKNIQPYFGTELFYLVNNEKYGSGFDIFRYIAGVELKIFKKQQIDIRWTFENLFNLGPITKEHIFRIDYEVDLN